MLVVERAALAPACCTVCMGTAGPFIDTLRTFDSPGLQARTGRIYLCVGCVTRSASEFGIQDEARESVEKALALAEDALERAEAAADVVAAAKDLHEFLDARLPKKRGRPRKKSK